MSFLQAELSKFLNIPAELYEFTNGVKKWYFTSSDQDIRYNDILWESQTIKREKIIMSNDLQRSDLKISLAENSPLKQYFLNDGLNYNLDLTVYRLQIEEDEAISFFNGTLGDFTIKSELEIQCNFRQIGQFVLAKSQRYKYGADCQHDQYSRKCGLSKEEESDLDLVIADINGNFITVDIPAAQQPADHFFTGLAWYYGENDTVERFIIEDVISGSQRIIKVDFVFDDLQVGDTINLAAGCQNENSRCKALNNFENFLAFEHVPDENFFVDGIKDKGTRGGSLF